MQIDTILFDMGGTLEDIRYSDSVARTIDSRMEHILDMPFRSITDFSGDEFFTVLQQRYKEYRGFREKTCIEVHPAMVWKDWVLKDFPIPDEKIFDHHEELAYFWETEVINRSCRGETAVVLGELQKRGIRLGIISNTGSFTQVHKSLEKYGIGQYFDKIALSSAYGIRKPHAFLFQDLLKQMGCEASRSLYVGDTISRDVVGAKNAGLYGSIQIRSEFSQSSEEGAALEETPDYIIQNLMSIPEIVDRINQS